MKENKIHSDAEHIFAALSGIDPELLARCEDEKAEKKAAAVYGIQGQMLKTAWRKYGRMAAACFCMLVAGVTLWNADRITEQMEQSADNRQSQDISESISEADEPWATEELPKWGEVSSEETIHESKETEADAQQATEESKKAETAAPAETGENKEMGTAESEEAGTAAPPETDEGEEGTAEPTETEGSEETGTTEPPETEESEETGTTEAPEAEESTETGSDSQPEFGDTGEDEDVEKIEISEETARTLPGIGQYIPLTAAPGYTFAWAKQTINLESGETTELSVQWISGNDYISWTVKRAARESLILADADCPASYNMYLYEEPYAGFVPAEYWEIFCNPIFSAEGLTQEIVSSRMKVSRYFVTNTPKGNFGVYYEEGILIEFEGSAEAAEIFKMFSALNI